jgi:hypothetical protein
VGCWWLLLGLSASGRLLWTVTLILVPSLLLLTVGPLRRLLVQEDLRDESLRVVRVLGFTRLFVNRLGGEIRLTRQFLPWLSGYAIAVFCLPGLLLAVPLRNQLLKLDATRFERVRTQGIEFVQLTEGASDRVQTDRSGFARTLLAQLVQRRIFDPAGPRPSTWLGLGALTVSCLAGFGVFGARALLSPKKARRVLVSTGAMEELLERLDLPMMQRRYRMRLEAALQDVQPPVTDEARVPLLIQTCRVLECAARLGLGEVQRTKLLAWVLECEAHGGGFGPNRQVTLPHTVAVLRMLRRLNGRPAFGCDLHERWLRGLLTDCWRTRLAMAPSDWLEAVGLIVEGLEQIEGALERLLRQPRLGRGLVETALRFWQVSEQSTQDTKQLVMILAAWKHSSRSLSAELPPAWLPFWEKQLVSRHPETELKELADSVILLSRLFPGNYAQRASVIQVADNLEKHWRIAR